MKPKTEADKMIKSFHLWTIAILLFSLLFAYLVWIKVIPNAHLGITKYEVVDSIAVYFLIAGAIERIVHLVAYRIKRLFS